MESPHGILPKELINQSKKAAVIEWLDNSPLERKDRRRIFLGWAVEVGVKLNRSDYAKAFASAPDAI